MRAELERAVVALARVRPEIERVLLFGSLVTGRAAPGSDADLLVILSQSDRPFRDRIPLYIPSGCRIPIDVFPYTQSEIHRMLADGNFFLQRALDQGVELPLARPAIPC